MSLLREILDKMYVEPELLEQLDEDQKQTLYIKMREEQIRRWKIYDEETSAEPIKHSNKRRIEWLTGRDGEVWVWVMGDHPNDRTIEEIIEEEAKRKAREIAETEALTASLKFDESVSDTNLDEQYLKKQLSKMNLGHDLQESASNGIQHSSLSLYDEAGLQQENHKPILSNSFRQPFNTPKPEVSNSNGTSNYEHLKKKAPIESNVPIAVPIQKAPPPIPSRPAFLQKRAVFEPEQSTKSNSEQSYRPPERQAPTVYPVPITIHSNAGPQPYPSDTVTEAQPSRFPTNNNIVYSNDLPPNESNGIVRFRQPMRGLLADEDIEKRQSEIFEKLMEEKDHLQREAEEEEKRRREEFEEQERKSREAEAQIRLVAQRARQQYENNLRTSEALLPALKDTKAGSLKEAIKRLRPAKPLNRESLVTWFIESELPKGTGLDPKTKYPARWFHGVISREEAENLLVDKPAGSFLVRVSERIWGYVISYSFGNKVNKHFLIEVIPIGYQFLGTQQIVHKSLYDLVMYHETVPITAKGKEILRLPIGQTSAVPDYADLINTSDMYKFPYGAEIIRRF